MLDIIPITVIEYATDYERAKIFVHLLIGYLYSYGFGERVARLYSAVYRRLFSRFRLIFNEIYVFSSFSFFNSATTRKHPRISLDSHRKHESRKMQLSVLIDMFDSIVKVFCNIVCSCIAYLY